MLMFDKFMDIRDLPNKRPRQTSVGTQTEDPLIYTKVDPTAEARVKRQRELKQYEKVCPVGWRQNPESRDRFQNPAYSAMIPGAIPTKYPPRMLPCHLLDLLPNLNELQNLLIDQEIAEDLHFRLKAFSGASLEVNVVLLCNGKSVDSVPYRWILLRLFGQKWRYKGTQDFSTLSQLFCLQNLRRSFS